MISWIAWWNIVGGGTFHVVLRTSPFPPLSSSRSSSNVICCLTTYPFTPFALLMSVSWNRQAYILTQSPTNSKGNLPIPSSFINPGTFLFARGIPYILDTIDHLVAVNHHPQFKFHTYTIRFTMPQFFLCVKMRKTSVTEELFFACIIRCFEIKRVRFFIHA